jgi:hypothetical protein
VSNVCECVRVILFGLIIELNFIRFHRVTIVSCISRITFSSFLLFLVSFSVFLSHTRLSSSACSRQHILARMKVRDFNIIGDDRLISF